MTEKELDCALAYIVDTRGELKCYDYAADKCEALAQALRHGSDDLLKLVTEAQVGLLLVQIIMAQRISLDCIVDRLEKLIKEMSNE